MVREDNLFVNLRSFFHRRMRAIFGEDLNNTYRVLEKSSLFDSTYYKENNTDIGEVDPIDHFINVGHKERRSISPLLDLFPNLKHSNIDFLEFIVNYEKSKKDDKLLFFILFSLNRFCENIIENYDHTLRADINRLIQTNLSTYNIHQSTFQRFKHIYSGRDLVLFASGPSAADYSPINNAIHIGVNASFKSTPVPLDYIFIQDFSGKTPEYIKDLNDYESEKCTKFYGLTTEWLDDPNRVIPESEAILSKALRYRTDWAPVRYFSSKFAYDISTQPLGCFGSVVFPALQFALWTNPRRLYLVGCDCSLSGYSYDKEYKNFLLPNKIIEAYREFKIFASKYYPETEIISVNPVGLKGIFTDEYQNK